MVCSIWYLCSKQALGPKAGSPMLIVSQEEGSYRLYNPEEDRVYKAKSNYRFLGSSGKWFLVVDSRSDLYVINVFSNERVRLPPLETVKSSLYKIERLGGDKGFHEFIIIEHETFSSGNLVTAEDLRAVLWVDEKKGDYVVVWRFDACPYLRFCKKGDVRYREISTRFGVPSGGLESVVLKGYGLYVQTEQGYIRHLDLSGQHSFEDVWAINWHPVNTDVYERMGGYRIISFSDNFAVTTSGEVLLVLTITYESSFEWNRTFHLYKKQDTKLIKVDSLGDEALFLDFGITVPGDHTLGIEPNSIYLTRDDRFRHKRVSCIDICVYNLATKTIKRFPSLSNLKLKDAQCFQSDSFGESGCALQLEGCLVKYDNVMFYGVADTTAMVMSCGKPAGYKYESDELTQAKVLVDVVASSGTSYRVERSGKAQAVAQCTGDLSATDCQDCLMEAIQRLKLQPFCGTSTWGDVYLAKCYVGLVAFLKVEY
ncbi:hypothetical protein Bca52824_055466 [Brassica carinata]|uniref:Gnk2-homologous domain-containing protein n=1 Tax=Brassica carinata TaxID=52824 RepID=A0A8X7R9K4_BRACI|nr:hypothetical protein Bca52824_055466 [Brassica carinata]